MKRIIFYSVILIIAFGLILGMFVCNKRKVSSETAGVTAPSLRKTTIQGIKGEIDIQNAFIRVADKAGKAVVTISTERTHKVDFPRSRFRFKGFGSPFGEQDPFERFFEDFFGQFPEKEFKQRGLGSGFIIDKEGHILTNHHVIQGADKINVTLSDGRSFEGKVQGADPRSDIAVIKIKAKRLPTVQLGNSDLLQIGEWVVALGNPFGHVLKSPKPTITVGVVSALHRRIPAPGGERGYLDMIQTDAAINPGNSGGPLCDLNGKVIGINVVIFSTSGGYQGVGFAIPINEVKDIIGDLMEGKEIDYGWLGVSVQEITPEIAEYFNLPDKKGALISEILPDAPAKDAGLKEGDIIKAFNGKKLDTLHDLLKEVSNTKVGQTVRLNIIRDGTEQILTVKIGKRPARIESVAEKGFELPKEVKKWRGIKVIDITDEIAQELDLKDKEGVVIIDVDRSSPGYDAGLRKGEVIREINKVKIVDLADYKRVTAEAKGIVLIRTDRGYFTVKEDEKD